MTMTERKIIALTVFLTILILFGGVFFVSSTTSTPQITATQNVQADVIDPTSFDWGKIPMNDGNVSKKFTIKNTGKEPLKLFNIKTSCHCTQAKAIINGIESQNFGMSGYSSWVGEVKPGKDAQLVAIFDPAYHGPQGVGPVTRFVSVETNDKGNPKITFTLTGTVVK